MSIEIIDKQMNVIEARFQSARLDNSSYRNCAGFVSYMLGFIDKETLVRTDFLKEQLEEVDSIPFYFEHAHSIEEEEFLKKAERAEVIAIVVHRLGPTSINSFEDFINQGRIGRLYLHFALIDPIDRGLIYERPDIEHAAEHVNWRDIFRQDIYAGLEDLEGSEFELVFLKRKTTAQV